MGCGFGESFCVGVFWWGILVGFGWWGVCIVGRWAKVEGLGDVCFGGLGESVAFL